MKKKNSTNEASVTAEVAANDGSDGFSLTDTQCKRGRQNLSQSPDAFNLRGSLHYRTKPGHLETLKIHFPTSEYSGGRERSEQSGASKRVSGASR